MCIRDRYNINGNNYFKLRDVAQAMKEKKAQFEVIWNSNKQSIFITKDEPYTTIGGELPRFFESKNQTATPTTAKVFVDGTEVSFTAYNINGNNYFKLRDLGEKLDFLVEWNGADNQVIIGSHMAVSYTHLCPYWHG